MAEFCSEHKGPAIEPFENKIWLSSPTMHGDELEFIKDAYVTNWMSTLGKNIDEIERLSSDRVGAKYAVALSSGTAALHLAIKIAGVKPGDKVFCSDMTFSATANPIVYEGGVPVFIDSECDTWNMDPAALEKAFELYPGTKVVMLAHLYGTPAKIDEILSIANQHNAIVIEDAAESFGALYKGKETGSFGEYSCISFNGNKIITGSSGGMFFTNNRIAFEKVKKWSTQSREAAQWYQHEEIGYNYRMSNVIAGVVRGQLPYLDQHISAKREIYNRYKEGFKGLPITMNPYDAINAQPNFWLSCMIVNEDAMCKQVRSDNEVLYLPEDGKSCPHEILDAIASINAEGRPIWKPMHMQPIFRRNPFVTRFGDGRGRTNAYITTSEESLSTSFDIFNRGLCLPSDIKMTRIQQERIIEAVRRCFLREID